MSPDFLDPLCALLGADVRFLVIGDADLQTPGVGLQIGVEPARIDVLTSVSGVRFEEAWPRKVQANFAEGVRCHVIGLDELLQNKRAAGRPHDLADVAALERLHRLKK